jgi:hypothetical protein
VKLIPLALLCFLLLPGVASAQRRVTAPVDVGIGPAAFLFFGPVFEDQPIHTGLKISVEAVLDQEWLRKNQRLIPRKYRDQVLKSEELRFSPLILTLIPDSLIISPKYRNTGMYGATWRPFGVGMPLSSSPVRFSLDAGLILTYAYLYSDLETLPATHFLRPGLQLGADLEFQLSKRFLISVGWDSALYVPQRLGTLGELQPLRESIFHVGQAYVQLHFRFPYTTTL